MIPVPESDPSSNPRNFAAAVARGLPRAYAILFFSADVRLGWFLLVTSFLAPSIALSGVLGVIAAASLGWVLGFDRTNIRSGFSLFNPLLVCLTLGWLHDCYQFTPQVFAALWLGGVIGSFFLSVAMQQWFAANLGMSAHSLPAVIAAYVIDFLGVGLFGSSIFQTQQANALMDLNFLPDTLRAMFQAFGAMLFLSRTLPGLLVFCAVLFSSPLTCLVASAAFMTGASMLTLLNSTAYNLAAGGVNWCGFNFLLIGIALGSGYFIVSRASFVLAMIGALLCALVAIALETALRYFGLPASALPYNLVTVVMVYALRFRGSTCGLQASSSPGSLPESSVRKVLLNARRFPHLTTPALFLPLEVVSVVTQGFDGALTHRGLWNHALDFERDANGARQRLAGASLDEFPVYRTQVFAPCGGIAALVVSTVRDNAPGENNPDENWGNYIIIHADAGFYVMLAHLREGTVSVHVGQRLERGMSLGEVGNSGRSPVPHLHLQVQSALRPGAATKNFCLKHYIEITENAVCYRTSGIPAKDAQLRPPSPDLPLAAVLASWLPGDYRYRLTGEKGKVWEETISLDFDDAGRYRLRSLRAGARLAAFLSEGVFYAAEFEGSDASLLAYLALGMARVPCVVDEGVVWQDEASSIPFHQVGLRWLHDFVDPFVGPSLLGGTYRLEHDAGGWAVRSAFKAVPGVFSRAPRRAPREILLNITSRRLIARLEARLGDDDCVTAELVDYQQPG